MLKRVSKEFRIFVCGPTVQDNAHLGHAKTYIAFDVLVRWLLKKGNKVFFLMNITDIDDKIFDRAKRERIPYMDIANRFYNDFVQDLESLNILTVSKFCRVSNYVESSALLVQRMLDARTAYRLDGNIYFDVSKADHFGKLSHQSNYQLKVKQIDAAPGKRNSVDFLLWRKIPDAQEGIWDFSLGEGRPGWHIEDTAIAFEELSGPYDLHGGATELIFPHHEAELAQDESVSGRIPFVSVWMHTGLLLKDGEKMSKSLGNVVTVREALKKHSSGVIRYYFLKRHYRESFEVDLSELARSAEEFELIAKAANAAPKLILKDKSGSTDVRERPKFHKEFFDAMEDDLNTPKVVKILLEVSNKILDEKDNEILKSELAPPYWQMIDSLGFRLC